MMAMPRLMAFLGSSAPVMCFYKDLAGSACGALLPTGNITDSYDGITVTAIDNGMPVVVLRADDFGITGDEAPDALNANEDLKARLESIRLQVGHDMGLGDVSNKAVPKMCLVSKPKMAAVLTQEPLFPNHVTTLAFLARYLPPLRLV